MLLPIYFIGIPLTFIWLSKHWNLDGSNTLNCLVMSLLWPLLWAALLIELITRP